MRSIHSRLRALERTAPRVQIVYPGWDILCGAASLDSWLEEHKFKNPLQAFEAGARGPWLELEALHYWMRQEGFKNAADAVVRGGLPQAPKTLEPELRIQALSHIYHEVSDLVLYNLDKDIGPLFETWKSLGDHLARRPIPTPQDAFLAKAIELVASVRECIERGQ